MKQLFLLFAILPVSQTLRAQTDILISEPSSTSANSVVVGVGATVGSLTRVLNSVAIGFSAGAGQRFSSTNTVYIGAFAGNGSARGANHNVAIGAFSLANLRTSEYNVVVGDSAGYNSSSGLYNVLIGAGAGFNGASGGSNTFVGTNAGRGGGSGGVNTFLGFNAGHSNGDANANTFIGSFAGERHQSGDFNTFVGSAAGSQNTSGRENTFVGTSAGRLTTSSSNTMLGTNAGFSNTTGQFNTFVGVQAGQANTTGSANFIMGTNAGRANTTGSGNFFLGDNTGGGNTTGGFNVYLGTNSGDGTGVNGDNNVAIGYESGRQNAGGITNLFVGFRADAGVNGLTNATAIGPNARVNSSNSVVLGNGANVGIGTSAPIARLHLTAGTANQSGLLLENLTASSPASLLNQTKFLTVDGTGNVILASITSSARQSVADAFWQRHGEYMRSTATGGLIIGEQINQTPAGYRLFVQDGILTEKVKVAVQHTADWSDKVFAPSYTLRTLAEVERYVKHHKHLPGVPSATEVVREGVDMARMDATLLEKIEELTLYSIQLEKKTQRQEIELRTIRQKQAMMEQLLEQVLNQQQLNTTRQTLIKERKP